MSKGVFIQFPYIPTIVQEKEHCKDKIEALDKLQNVKNSLQDRVNEVICEIERIEAMP